MADQKKPTVPAWANGRTAGRTTAQTVPTTPATAGNGGWGGVQGGVKKKNPWDKLNDPMINPAYNANVPNFNTPESFNRADANRRAAVTDRTIALRDGDTVNPNAGNPAWLNQYLGLFNGTGGIGMPNGIGGGTVIPNNAAGNGNNNGNGNGNGGNNTPDPGQIVVNGSAGTPRYGEDTRNLYQILNAPISGALPPMDDGTGSTGGGGFGSSYGGNWRKRGGGGGYGGGYSNLPSWYLNLNSWNIK